MAMTDRRRALAAISIATSLSLLGDTAMYTVLPTHTASAGVALASVGILLSANRFIRLFLNGPIGILTDRWPRRRIFVPAVFLGALSTAIYAWSGSFWPLLSGRLLWGIAWAGLWISGNAIVLDVSPEHKRGRSVGIYYFSFYLGAAAGSMLGGILTDWLGYHRAMAIAAGFTLIGAMVALFMLPETSGLNPDPSSSSSAGAPEAVRAPSDTTDWRQLFSATGLLGVNRFVMAGVFLATFGLFLAQILGESIIVAERAVGVTTITGLGIGLSTLLGMVAAPAAGGLSDRIKSRWRVVSGGLVTGMTGFGLLAAGTSASILFGLPLVSIASGANQGLSTTLVGDLSPRRRHGRRLGLLYTVGDFASAIGPPIAYALIPLIGLSSLYLMSAGLFGLMLLVALWWTARNRRQARALR
jgi:MFS family permease